MAPVSALLSTPALDLGFMTGMFQTGRDAASTRWRLGLETPPSTEGSHLALAKYALTLALTDQRALSGTAFTTEGVFRAGTNRWLSVNFASAPLQLTNRAIAWQRIPN